MDFVEIARFPSRYEAETVGHALDEHGIPFLVQSADVGIFGPGMGGFSPEGAALKVPRDRVEEVSRLLTCVVQPIEADAFGPGDPAGDDPAAGDLLTGDSVDD
ncbi:MAG: hypothetical protein AAGN46_00145 [Acidobacteriota bacterium]